MIRQARRALTCHHGPVDEELCVGSAQAVNQGRDGQRRNKGWPGGMPNLTPHPTFLDIGMVGSGPLAAGHFTAHPLAMMTSIALDTIPMIDQEVVKSNFI